jgi:hypothetical protein
MNDLIQLTSTIPSARTSLTRSPLRRGLPRKQQLPRTQATWTIRGFVLISLVFVCFALLPTARAVTPAPDGGYPNQNTAEGTNALLSLSSGSNNTAIGFSVLGNTTTGSDNTANGAYALLTNSTGSDNTATGIEALNRNTIGLNNTANGVNALFFNSTGNNNTANGVNALFNNTAGGTTGGSSNTAEGMNALMNNTSGSNNIALGVSAGANLTTGKNNIDIGNVGVAAESAKIRIGTKGTHKQTFIAGISGATVAGGVGVIVNSSGQLGTVTSSARFKEAIKPMDKASEAILALKPVTFHYKQDLDPDGIPQFGLVAEQVEKVNPDLVARDEEGKPYTVRYEAVNAMLLNEFLKEHRMVQELKSIVAKQEATAAQQQTEIKALTASLKKQDAQIEKVSAQIETTKPAPHVLVNNP